MGEKREREHQIIEERESGCETEREEAGETDGKGGARN
jgi:hypothetical protein